MLYVFLCRLKDVESVKLTSNLQRSLDWDISKGLSFSNGRGNDAQRAMPRSRSALTKLLTDGVIKRWPVLSRHARLLGSRDL
jgi:hypothetical protein